MNKKSYLFHTHILDLTGGSKSILNISKGLMDRGHKVAIMLEKELVRYSLPKNLDVYVITLFGIKKLNSFGFKDINIDKKNRGKKQDVKKVILNIKFIRYILIWLRYLLNVLQFPIKNYYMKKFLNRNDFDFAISSNMYVYLEHLYYYKNRIPKVFMSLRNSPINIYRNRITPHLLPLSSYYKNVTCIGVSNETTMEMEYFIDKNVTNLKTIYNPFDFDVIKELAKKKISIKDNLFLISVGSLTQRKRVDLTIKAFANINYSKVKLLIIGQGDMEKDLKLLVRKLNLGQKVIFVGATANPYKYMSKAKALVMTSESEGLPRVLIEALICGIPVISTDCPTGPKEILLDELSELLVPMSTSDEQIVNDIKEKINLIMKKDITPNKENLERFSFDSVIRKWERI